MTARDQVDLGSLGTLMYEPLFLFVRDEPCALACGLKDLIAVASKRVIGGSDSGTQVLARLVLNALLPGQAQNWQTLPTPVTRQALLAGDIDAAFVIEAGKLTSQRSCAIRQSG